MNLPVKLRRDWHYYAFAIGLIFILNGGWDYWDLKRRGGKPMRWGWLLGD